MDKLSGLKLDIFDDEDGSILRGLFPAYGELPELVKNAGVLTEEDRNNLPDDVYALVLRDGDVTLRKYACVDAGNVMLNIAYLLAQSHLLPVEATKVAASNLCVACHWYDIEPPDELKKMSTGSTPVIGKQQVWKDMDGTLYGVDHQDWSLHKTAEIIGSVDMPLQSPPSTVNDTKSKKLSVIPKTAEVDLLEEAFGIKVAEEPDLGKELPTKDNPESFPQVKVLKPHVDVTGKEPPKLVHEKNASYCCMPSIGKYPIDTFNQVKVANVYFQSNHRLMVPEDRREFAVNLCKRAEQLSYPLSTVVEEYGLPGFAKRAHVQNCIDTRKLLLQPHAEQGDTEQLKVASADLMSLYDQLMGQYGLMHPDVFAATLVEIDKRAGINPLWDADVPDPYYSTFAKTAAEADPKDAILLGNEYMNVRDLQIFARSRPDTLKTLFGCEFLEEFQKDPTAIFDSLPADQKKVIMRLVNNSHSMGLGASAS